jgi:hypothetical protein
MNIKVVCGGANINDPTADDQGIVYVHMRAVLKGCCLQGDHIF